MAYVKTIYNNPRQINGGNLNKIENKLEELDKYIEELKEKVDMNEKIISSKCTAKTVKDGTKLTFTFILSDDSKLNCEVVIPKEIIDTENKSE